MSTPSEIVDKIAKLRDALMGSVWLADTEAAWKKGAAEFVEREMLALVSAFKSEAAALRDKLAACADPIPMWLSCPRCGELHVDEGEFAKKPHHTHSCQYCGLTWRPAVVPTVGVQFLPGFKNEASNGPR